MFQLEFSRICDYSGQGDSVVVPVVVRSGPKQGMVAASVDTAKRTF